MKARIIIGLRQVRADEMVLEALRPFSSSPDEIAMLREFCVPAKRLTRQ